MHIKYAKTRQSVPENIDKMKKRNKFSSKGGLSDMKKTSMYFLFVCLLLTGCASDKTKHSAENRKKLTIDINKIQLPIEQDCSLGSYFVDGDVVYYSVYMPVGDYEENPDAQFDVSMETEIRSFKR